MDKPKTIQEVRERYLIAMRESYGRDIELKDVILDILNVLVEKENEIYKQYKNDSLWMDIVDNQVSGEGDGGFINLPILRGILEKYKILGDEKNGM